MHADRPGNLYFQPIAMTSGQIPRDSLESEQGATRAQHAHQPGHVLHLIPIPTPITESVRPPQGGIIPPARIPAPLPTLNGEVVLCLATKVMVWIQLPVQGSLTAMVTASCGDRGIWEPLEKA